MPRGTSRTQGFMPDQADPPGRSGSTSTRHWSITSMPSRQRAGKAFGQQIRQVEGHPPDVLQDDLRTHPARPAGIPLDTDRRRHIQHDGKGRIPVLAGQCQPLPPPGGPQVHGIGHDQPAQFHPPGHDHRHQVEGLGAGGLVGLAIADEFATEIGTDDRGLPEVPAGEGALAAAGQADQHGKRTTRDGQRDRHAIIIATGCLWPPPIVSSAELLHFSAGYHAVEQMIRGQARHS